MPAHGAPARIRITGRLAEVLARIPVAVGDPLMLGVELTGGGSTTSLYRVLEIAARERRDGRRYTIVVEESDQ